MKLSVELKVAAAVAAAFMALTPGAMAQGRSRGQTAGANHFGPTNRPGVNTNMSQQGDNNSVLGRTNTDENRQKFSDENPTSSTREQRVERHEAREQREERHEAREQREERHDARKQEEHRRQEHRQRAQRYQRENTKDKSPSVKSPFDGSILEVKPVEAKQ
jgi:hypothetical protein